MHVRDGRPAENNGIAALQLHEQLVGLGILHYMIFALKMFSEFKKSFLHPELPT